MQELLEEIKSSKIDLTNEKLLAETQAKIDKIEFKLNGIIERKNRKTGEIIVEKVGELHLSEFLAIELGKMKERLAVLLKINKSQNC